MNQTRAVIAVMILIIAIAYVVDGVVFKSKEQGARFAARLTPST